MLIYFVSASLMVWMIVTPKHHTPINLVFIRYENRIIMTQSQIIKKISYLCKIKFKSKNYRKC